jgi:hypothetical protein
MSAASHLPNAVDRQSVSETGRSIGPLITLFVPGLLLALITDQPVAFGAKFVQLCQHPSQQLQRLFGYFRSVG